MADILLFGQLCVHAHACAHLYYSLYLKKGKKLFQKTCMMIAVRCRKVLVGCTVCKCRLLFCYFHLNGEFTQHHGYWVSWSVQRNFPRCYGYSVMVVMLK